MELIIISVLLFISIGLLVYQFVAQRLAREVHLPSEIKGGAATEGFDFSQVLTFPAQYTDLLASKANIPLENLKKRLTAAGKPMGASQFFAWKVVMMLMLPSIAFVVFQATIPFLILALSVGFIFPDFWLNNKIKKRQIETLRTLPHIIDLLNICVGAGLDFMVAVNHTC